MSVSKTTSNHNSVAIYKEEDLYPVRAPFHPFERYPEYPAEDILSESNNTAYSQVRNALHLLELDKSNFGQAAWNPLGDLIEPGDYVLLKPNLICESHSSRQNEWEQVITHPSIIRAVLDYVLIALKGKGELSIADVQQADSDCDEKLDFQTGTMVEIRKNYRPKVFQRAII